MRPKAATLAAGAAALALVFAVASALPATAGGARGYSGELLPRNGSGLGGLAALDPEPSEEGGAPSLYTLRLAIELAPRKRAFAAHLRRGSCEAPGALVAKAEPELNAQSGPAAIRIPAGALPDEEGRLPETLVVEVKEQDGRVVSCGLLRPREEEAGSG